MKIILILGGLDTNGGMFNYLCSWAEKVKKENNTLAICATQNVLNEINVSCDFEFALPYNSNESLKKIYKNLLLNKYSEEFKYISDEINKFDPDYVHFVDETIFFPFLQKIFGKFKKYITIHDPIYHKGQFRSKITRTLCFYSRLSYFFCGSLYLHFHGRKKIFPSITYFYRNKVFISHPLPKRLVFDVVKNEVPVVAFLGRIEQYKGIYLFIDSIAEFAKISNKQIKVIIAGSGKFETNELMKIEFEMEFDNRFIENDEFHRIMNKSDIVVLPYLSATQSGVGYLAKSYNKKIICTDVGNLSDLIENHNDGFVVGSTPIEVARAIKELVEHDI